MAPSRNDRKSSRSPTNLVLSKSIGNPWKQRGEIVVTNKMDDQQSTIQSTIGRADVALIASLDAMVEELYRNLNHNPIPVQSQQLSSAIATAYEWIWNAEAQLGEWLEGNDSFFWISGQPGTGKSTLIQYLTQSKTTRSHLSKHYATFRLAKFSLNLTESPPGRDKQRLLKAFLAQLCLSSRDIESRLAAVNDRRPLADADPDILLETFCDEVNDADYHLCALIDGLDGYDGDDEDLVEILISLQRRTTMKFIVTCTPDRKAFVDAFGNGPHLQMQVYNYRNIRNYLDISIDDHRSEDPFINSILVDVIRAAIVERSGGVVVWTKLAVTELMQYARQGASTAKMRSILEELPQDLSEMYTLTIKNKTRNQQVEVAFLLKFIAVLQIYGQAPLRVLRGFWMYFYPLLPTAVPFETGLQDSTFEVHFKSLLGNLVYIDPNDQLVRLSHKTLTTFLNNSPLIASLLPTRFQNTNTKEMFMSICTSIIRDATVCQGTDTTTIIRKITKQGYFYNRLNSSYTPSLTGLDFPKDERWQAQSAALEYCLLSVGQEICSYTSQPSILGSHYIASWKSCLNLCLTPSPTRLKKHELKQLLDQDINDLLTAIRFGSVEYLGSNMSTFKRLSPQHKDVLFRYALEWTPRSGSFHSNWKLARLLAPYVDVLTTPMLDLFIHLNDQHYEEQEDDDCPDPQPEPGLIHVLAILGSDCEEKYCGISGIDGPKFGSLLHWWFETSRESTISLNLLGTILRFAPDVDVDFSGQGTAISRTVELCREEHTLTKCPLRLFMMFAALGADPEVKVEDCKDEHGDGKVSEHIDNDEVQKGDTSQPQALLELAESIADPLPTEPDPSSESPKRSKWKRLLSVETQQVKTPIQPRRVKQHSEHACDIESVVELLRSYRENKRWPNLWDSNLFGIAAGEMAWADYSPLKRR